MTKERLVTKQLIIGIFDPAFAQRLLRQIERGLDDRQPRHQPPMPDQRLFDFHHRESELLVSPVHYFALSSILKFDQASGDDLRISLLTLALQEDPTRHVWEKDRPKFKSPQSG